MPRVKVVRRTLADGRVKEYRYVQKPPRAKTMGDLIAEYRRAPEFRQLAENTKKTYLRAFDRISSFHKVAARDIRRGHIMQVRDAYQDTPALANQIVAVWAILMQFAYDREYIAANPARRIKAYRLGEHRRWKQEEIAHALETMPEHGRRAVLLALYTGQRAGDCIAMCWSDYDGEAIQVTQEKTGVKLWIPCHEELRAELDGWRRDAVTILTNSLGQSWKPASFYTRMSQMLRDDPKLSGLVFHGLRKSAAARLAEAGCSVNEIAAITGHATLQMLALYTREAEQRSLARSAVTRLEIFRPGKRGKESG